MSNDMLVANLTAGFSKFEQHRNLIYWDLYIASPRLAGTPAMHHSGAKVDLNIRQLADF